jgi:hypothetical protein
MAKGRLQGVDHFSLDQKFPASAPGLGSDRTGRGPQGKHHTNPSGGDAKPLGDLLLCAFGRVYGGQNSLAKVLGIRDHNRRPTS